MADTTRLTIPEEAVEQALLGAMGHDACADDEAPKGDEYFTEQMRWALRAAAPLIVAAYLKQIAGDTNCLDDSVLLVDYAAELRGGAS